MKERQVGGSRPRAASDNSEIRMPMNQTEIDTFNTSLTDALPRLRVYARSLTHDRERADNLVQQASLNALVGRESFRPGTNFGAWIFRIQRNEFITQLRREQRIADTVDAETVLATPAAQENRLIMREFMASFRQLSRASRQALLLSKIVGYSYEQIASHAGIAEGTVKSRISRARKALERLLAGDARGSGIVTRSREPADLMLAPPVAWRGKLSQLPTVSPGG